MKARLKPEAFSFAVGKIRVLETALIKRITFQQMVEADLKTALKIWAQQRFYPEEVNSFVSPDQIEDFLIAERKRAYLIVQRLIPSQYLLQILMSQDLERALSEAKGLNNEFLKRYICSKIDLTNIKNFLRTKLLENKEELKSDILLGGGFLEREFFLKIFNFSQESIVDNFKPTAYFEIVSEGLAYFNREGCFIRLECLMDNFLLSLIRPQKYNPFGPEPVLSYLLAKENELRLLRLVFLAKIYEVRKESILERLNDTYV